MLDVVREEENRHPLVPRHIRDGNQKIGHDQVESPTPQQRSDETTHWFHAPLRKVNWQRR
jgi:hypothetical protein